MKLIHLHQIGLLTGTLLLSVANISFAAESHATEALKHAEAAAKSTDDKSLVEHAEIAKTHTKVAHEHLTAGLTSLDNAIDHAKQKHSDIAKKAAEEAVTHLKAAQ